MSPETRDAAPRSMDANPRGRCAHCGAKLPDVPVSLCPYCASPVESQAERKAQSSVHAARIRRVPEHADYAAALAWTPPEGPRWLAGARRVGWTQRLLAIAAVVAALALVSGGSGAILASSGSGLASLLFWGAVALAGFAVWNGWQGRRMQAEALTLPLLKRPAILLDRRSVTRIRGWHGDTTYYFKIEFEDGSVGEFAYPGLGPQEEPYATGLPGLAYTRGQDLLHFRHIRV